MKGGEFQGITTDLHAEARAKIEQCKPTIHIIAANKNDIESHRTRLREKNISIEVGNWFHCEYLIKIRQCDNLFSDLHAIIAIHKRTKDKFVLLQENALDNVVTYELIQYILKRFESQNTATTNPNNATNTPKGGSRQPRGTTGYKRTTRKHVDKKGISRTIWVKGDREYVRKFSQKLRKYTYRPIKN